MFLNRFTFRRPVVLMYSLSAFALLAIILACIVYGGKYIVRGRCSITVINDSPGHVADVHITHRHKCIEYVPDIPAHQSVHCVMRPFRESNLRVSYVDSNRTLVVKECDAYVGGAISGSVTIRIQKDEVTTEQVP